MKRGTFVAVAAAAAMSAARARAQVRPLTPIYPQQQYLQQLSIAINATLSGPLQKYGQEMLKGVQAAVDETNRFTPSTSHVWGVRPFDDRNDATLAAANAGSAAADTSVVGIIGNLTAPMTLASLSQYANSGFALIVPTVTADAVTKRGYHNVYRLPANDSTSGQLFARAVLPGFKSVPTIAVALDGDYGYDVARGYVDKARSDGHPADVLLFPHDKLDPAQAARTVLDRSPGYVFLAGKTAELGPVALALRLAGYTGAFGASDGFYNLETLTSYARVLADALVASPMPPLDRIPTGLELLTDFEREVTQVTAFSAYAYAAAQIFITAAQTGNVTTRFAMLRALQQGGTFTTLVGQFSFTVSGDPLLPNIYLYTLGTKGFTYARPAVRTGFVI